MSLFNKIVVPTDFSMASKKATEYAIDFLEGVPTEILLVNSFEPPHMGSGMLISINDILEKESLSGLRKELLRLEKNGKLNGHSCNTITGEGQPIDLINTISLNKKADAIFIGNNGAGGFEKAIYGSNTGNIIASAEVPVFSIPTGFEYSKIKNICLSFDGKKFNNDKIAPTLEKLRENKDANLTIFHTKTPKNEKYNNQIDQNLQDLLNTFPKEKVKLDIVESQYSDDGIQNYFSKNDFDLICMVPRNETFIKKFLPSQTKSMASIANKPLWTFHD